MKPKIHLVVVRDDVPDLSLAGARNLAEAHLSCWDGTKFVGEIIVEVAWPATGDVPELRLRAGGKFAWGDIFSEGVPCWPPVPMQPDPEKP